jgi:hypothetical protein
MSIQAGLLRHQGETRRRTMETTIDTAAAVPAFPATSKARLWTGRVLTGLPALFMAWGALMSLTRHPQAVEGATQMGFSPASLAPISIVTLFALACLALRRTAPFGALLLTGYLGGAVSIHVRQGDPLSAILLPVIFSTLIWLGVYLRDERVRAVSPIAR